MNTGVPEQPLPEQPFHFVPTMIRVARLWTPP
jgi:hypothetical protein